ncbi:MAG: integrase core domain-containing protein, partial [Acidimicrobiales bacterium]
VRSVETLRTPVRAPHANTFAERWVETVRADCLDHLLIFSHRQLERVLRTNIERYNEARPHRGIGLDTPRPTALGDPVGRTERRAVLDGLIHEFRRAARATQVHSVVSHKLPAADLPQALPGEVKPKYHPHVPTGGYGHSVAGTCPASASPTEPARHSRRIEFVHPTGRKSSGFCPPSDGLGPRLVGVVRSPGEGLPCGGRGSFASLPDHCLATGEVCPNDRRIDP